MTICFTVRGKLRGKGRPRFSRRTGAVYTPKETVLYEHLIRDEYIAAGGKTLNGAIRIRIDIYHGISKSFSKKKRAALLSSTEPIMKKPDVDNITKIVLDALNGIAYADDVQVIQTIATKVSYADEPRIVVEVKGK